MLAMMPSENNVTTRLEPPYEINGKGIPATGINPRHMQEFFITMTWML